MSGDTEIETIGRQEKWLNLLKSENKFERKKGLENILKVSKIDSKEQNKENETFDEDLLYYSPVLRCLMDPMEKCREISYFILTIFTNRLPLKILKEKYLPSIIPILVERLGEQEMNENSEEVRLLGVEFIKLLISKFEKDLSPFVDDLLLILANTIVDPFHEVRKSSCTAASQLAKILPEVFHYNSGRLVKPLSISIVHQQFRVREAVVFCIGNIVQYGNYKLLEDLIPYITQRVFDDSPYVRKAVVQIVGHWSLNYLDRYSYFHRFIPFIMTGICDENIEIKELSESIWKECGEKYLKENLEEFKDQVDFPSPFPVHYPKNVNRPSFGCRILFWRNAIKLIPGINNDITDWSKDTRIKTAQLLYMLILNCEDKITMHSEKILHCLFKACLDEDPIVSDYVKRSAELIGYFVPFTIIWPILSASIISYTNSSPYIVFSLVLKGSDPKYVEEVTLEVSNLISDKDICQTLKIERQKCIISICSSLMELTPTQSSKECSQNIFLTILTVLGMTNDSKIGEEAVLNLKRLQEVEGLEDLDDLMSRHCPEVLENMKSEYYEWTSSSPDKMIFETIISFGGSILEKNMDIILSLMTANLSPEKDPEVRLKFFTMLAEKLQECKENSLSEESNKNLELFVKNIIEDVLNPNLVWKAGRSADALRSAATSCILSILQGKILTEESILEISPKLIPALVAIIDDSSYLTRIFVLRSLIKIIAFSNKNLSPDVLHSIYMPTLKRLDDVNNEVRLSACHLISCVFTNLPKDYNVDFCKGHIENVYSVLLLHLDDMDEELQKGIFDTLIDIGGLRTNFLISSCEKAKGRHRTPELCSKLINYFVNEKSSEH